MNRGVEILIERIKTHPEEFLFEEENPFKESKWKRLISAYKPFLSEEDVKALDNAINGVIQEKFTAKVMEELLDPKVEEQLTLTPSKQRTGFLSAGQTQGASSLSSVTLGNTITNRGYTTYPNPKTVEQMLTEITNSIRQKPKKHQTLFGKLYNYLGTNK